VTLIATALLPEGGRRRVAREFEEAKARPVSDAVVASAPSGSAVRDEAAGVGASAR
jgi:hypothetical protein